MFGKGAQPTLSLSDLNCQSAYTQLQDNKQSTWCNKLLLTTWGHIESRCTNKWVS